MRDKNNQLEAQVARITADYKETESLKRELGFKTDSGFDTIPAEVSFFDPTNVRGTIIIDKGKNQGIVQDMAATSQGTLIGRVTDVYADSSKILLITDPFSSIPAQLTTVEATGLVQGQVGMGLVINEVPQETDLKKGETIVTSGLGGQYPKGLILGTVENVTKQNNSIFQSASLRTLVDFNSLERVQIIKN